MKKNISMLSLICIALTACAGVPAITPLPEQLGTPVSSSNTACIFPSSWTIEYNRSGGFVGLNDSMTLDQDGILAIQSERPPLSEEKTISEDQVMEIANLLVQTCPFEIPPSDNGCADCFLYELIIQMNGETYSVQATDVTLTNELHSLINILSELLQNTDG